MRRRLIPVVEWGTVLVAPAVGVSILLGDNPRWFVLSLLLVLSIWVLVAIVRRQRLDDQVDELDRLRRVAAMDIALYLREWLPAPSGVRDQRGPFDQRGQIRESCVVRLSAEQAYLAYKYGGYDVGEPPAYETIRLGDMAVALTFSHARGISMPIAPVQIRNLL